jgi:hypothetical protein
LEAIIGAFVWAAANYLYADMKRKGKRGLSRFFLFWMGTPTNWLWFFLVKEGSEPEEVEAPDDADALLEEIRRERALGSGPPEEPSVRDEADQGADLEPKGPGEADSSS